jgi:L-malate glycosyltransferase
MTIMKILFFNYEYPPLGGGAANATDYILKEFSKIPDLEVDLVTSSIDENYSLEKIGGAINIHRLPIGKNKSNLHFQSQKDLLVYAWKAYCFSKKLARESKYDLSHSFFTVPCGFISLVLKLQYKIPYIVSLRGSDVPGYSERFSFLYIFLKPLVRFIWKKSYSVVSNSQGLKDLALKTNSRQKIDIIHNGIDTETFKPGKKNPVSENKIIIIPGASRLTPRKGIDYLIKAFGKLSAKYPNLILKIIGDGNEKENLEKMVKELNLEEKVIFAGLVPHEKVLAYYQEADIFVLPSLNEGMSNSMLEALSVGLPLVATDTGGTNEIIAENKNGYIVKMKDSQDIADKLEKLIINPELRKKMGEFSHEKAQSLSWRNVAMDYHSLYEKISIKP